MQQGVRIKKLLNNNIAMNLFFSKCKFTTGLFYKRVDDARIEFKDGVFKVQILPFFNYSGHYHVHSVIRKTSS